MANLGKIVGIILGLIFFIFLVLAMNWGALGQTVNSIEYPIGFVELTKERVEYGKTIEFNPPDGVAKIISAVVTIQGDFDSDNQVYVTLNRQPCEPQTWKVSASAAGTAVGYKMTFDCTNVLSLEKSGYQDVKFSMDFPAKNVNAIYKITYYNEPSITLEDINKKLDNQSIIENINKIVSKPRIDLSLHGTEYSVGDINGKLFLQLLNNIQEPITNTSCFIKLFYPNTTTFVSTTLMNNFTEGLHYYDFAVPETLGVYMASAFCYIPDPVNVIASDDFECGAVFNCGSGWTNNWITAGTVEIINTFAPFQGLWHMRLSGGTPNSQAERTVNTNLTGCTASYLTFYAKASGLEVGDYCYYKLNTGTQNITLLEITTPNDDNTYRYYSFEICQYNITGSPKIILNDTGINLDDRCFIDDVKFNIAGIINTTQYQRIMGSGEVHVSNATNITAIVTAINNTAIAQSVWNYSIRTLTDYNQSAILGFLTDINGTLHYLNSSEYQHYLAISGNLSSVQATLIEINTTINAINSSVANISLNLTPVEDLITSVNQSIWSKLILIQGDLQDLNNSISGVANLVSSVNSSLANQLNSITTQITGVSNLITNVNTSIWSKLLLIQDDLVSINQTVISVNTSQTDLTLSVNQSIQNEIQNLMNQLAIDLANITNLTLNLSMDVGQVSESTWTLFFKRGTPPLAPSTTYFCLDNYTLIKRINYTFIENNNTLYFDKDEQELCPYGCDMNNNACNMHPAWRWGIVIAISIAALVGIYFILRRFKT